MEKKTVTMDYFEHETLLKRIKLFEESKLCTLRIINEDLYSGMKYEKMRFSINGKEELRVVIKQLIDTYTREITAPDREYAKELKTRIFNLETELEKYKKPVANKTFRERLMSWFGDKGGHLCF